MRRENPRTQRRGDPDRDSPRLLAGGRRGRAHGGDSHPAPGGGLPGEDRGPAGGGPALGSAARDRPHSGRPPGLGSENGDGGSGRSSGASRRLPDGGGYTLNL